MQSELQAMLARRGGGGGGGAGELDFLSPSTLLLVKRNDFE